MKLWDLIDMVEKYPDSFTVIKPDPAKIPLHRYYFIKIIRYYPNRDECSHIIQWTRRYRVKNPELSESEIFSFCEKFDVEIDIRNRLLMNLM